MTKEFKGHPLFTIYDTQTDEYWCFNVTAKYATFLFGLTLNKFYTLLAKKASPYKITRTYVSLDDYRKKSREDEKRIRLIKKGALPV